VNIPPYRVKKPYLMATLVATQPKLPDVEQKPALETLAKHPQ